MAGEASTYQRHPDNPNIVAVAGPVGSFRPHFHPIVPFDARTYAPHNMLFTLRVFWNHHPTLLFLPVDYSPPGPIDAMESTQTSLMFGGPQMAASRLQVGRFRSGTSQTESLMNITHRWRWPDPMLCGACRLVSTNLQKIGMPFFGTFCTKYSYGNIKRISSYLAIRTCSEGHTDAIKVRLE